MNISLNSSDCGIDIRTIRIHLMDNRHAATARAFFSSVFAIFTVLDNIAVMVAVQRSTVTNLGTSNDSTRDKRSISKILMMSSGFAGVLIGALLMPLGVYEFANSGRWFLGKALCSARLAGLNIACALYANHILCMSIDRYLAVCKSMMYRSLTSKLGYAMVGMVWILPFLCFTIFFANGLNQDDVSDIVKCYRLRDMCIFVFNLKSLIKVNIFGVYIPFLTTVAIYVFILRETCRFNTRKSKHMQANSSKEPHTTLWKPQEICLKEANDNTVESSNSSDAVKDELPNDKMRLKITLSASQIHLQANHCIIPKPPSSEILSKKKHAKCASIRTRLSVQLAQNKKAVRTIGSILLCYTLCWLPLWVCTVMGILRLQVSDVWLFNSVQWFAYLNATVNPLIFCLNKSVRIEMRKLLCMFKTRRE